MSLARQNYNVDFEEVPEDGQTLIWGSVMTPIKKIIYHHDGKTYTVEVGKFPVWHMILPFEEQTFLNAEWSMELPNGKTAPLFKH